MKSKRTRKTKLKVLDLGRLSFACFNGCRRFGNNIWIPFVPGHISGNCDYMRHGYITPDGVKVSWGVVKGGAK